MSKNADTRNAELKIVLDYLEQERDKLYDQVANLQGQKERMDWTIKVLNGRILQVEQEEAQKEAAAAKQAEVLALAKEKGNIGSHPDERKESLKERRKAAKKVKKEKADK